MRETMGRLVPVVDTTGTRWEIVVEEKRSEAIFF
jgi:hypothetical protein